MAGFSNWLCWIRLEFLLHVSIEMKEVTRGWSLHMLMYFRGQGRLHKMVRLPIVRMGGRFVPWPRKLLDGKRYGGGEE